MSKNMRIPLFVLALAALPSLLSARPLPTESGLPQAQISSLHSAAIKAFKDFVAERMAFDRIPGLSVAFLKDGAVWAEGFGYADLENNVPATAESAYRLASITKTITAVAVLQLWEQGLIDLDAEIQTYVPYFPRKKWPVTVRQLLGHVGGISPYQNYAVEGRIKEPKDTKEALAIFQDIDLTGEPGTIYRYTTYGYNLLGAAVESASGESYGDYIRRHIFEPLDMANSRIESARDLISNRVRGYRIVDGELVNSEFVDVSSRFAGGGTRSTVADLMKYARAIIDGGLLRQETRRMMFSSMALRSGFFTWYGMGWTVQPWNGRFAASHGGSQPETKTFLLILPTERFAAAVAANLESVDIMPYVRRLAELVLDENMTLTAYGPDRNTQAILNSLSQAFSYGLSYYEWNKTPLPQNRKDLDEGFEFLNKYLSRKALKNNFAAAKDMLAAGVHPGSNQALIRVGSYIAATLEKARGRDFLRGCRKSGPLAFFNDYIQLSRNSTAGKDRPRIDRDLAGMIAGWAKDWASSCTDQVRNLAITPGTDFRELEETLKKNFKNASVYPDFSTAMAALAQKYLEQGDLAKTLQILEISRSLYPNAPGPCIALAAAQFYMGNIEPAAALYQRAYSLDNTYAGISAEQMADRIGQLFRVKKTKEALSLCDLAAGFHSLDARAQERLADACLEAGQKEKALALLRNAILLDPKLESARDKLKAAEKRKREESHP